MNTRRLVLVLGAFLLAPAANAIDDIDLSMEMLFPQTSLMDVASDAVYMTAVLRPMYSSTNSGGRMLHVGWYDNKDAYRQSFLAMVGVRVPSKVPGFATLEEAVNADVRIRISSNGVDYAECLLAVDPVISRSAVYFAVDLAALWDEVRPSRGICDVNLNEPGLQVGIPQMGHKDVLTTFVKDKPYGAFEFLEGYCY